MTYKGWARHFVTGPLGLRPEPASSLGDTASIPRATHDLSRRTWGHNYEIMRVESGHRLRLALWSAPLPRDNDYLLLSAPDTADGKTRYRVEKIEPCWDPRDMAFADVVFDPRPPQGIAVRMDGDAQQGPAEGKSPVGTADAPNPSHQAIIKEGGE